MKSRPWVSLLGLITLLGFATSLNAASVVGGTGLLTQDYADQLEVWLGEGPLQLTSLGSLVSSSPPALTFDNFHDMVDTQGRTFVLIETYRGRLNDGTPAGRALLGGYSPRDWIDSRDGNVLTPQIADMSAFIFNLTSGTKLDQSSQYQTGSATDFAGIRFGLGDLFIAYDEGPHSGLPTVTNWNYCSPGTPKAIDQTCKDGQNLVGEIGLSYVSGGPTTLEAFTISAVPIPPALYLFGTGLIGLVGVARRKITEK